MLNLNQAGTANLVANHMTTLLSVSSDAAVLYTQYVAEPIIAIAAAVEGNLDERIDGRIEELLEGLLGLFNSGNAGAIFSAGDAGDFIASKMLMRGYDGAIGAIIEEAPSAGYYVGRPATLGAQRLGTYLEGILNAKALAKATRKCGAILLDSFVCVLQIIAIERVLDQKKARGLSHLLWRHLSKGHYSADGIIPVLLAIMRDETLKDLLSMHMNEC